MPGMAAFKILYDDMVDDVFVPFMTSSEVDFFAPFIAALSKDLKEEDGGDGTT
jgi:hypothetical protein